MASLIPCQGSPGRGSFHVIYSFRQDSEAGWGRRAGRGGLEGGEGRSVERTTDEVSDRRGGGERERGGGANVSGHGI